MSSLCLMDPSYLTLKETTADDRTVRTQHILETTHNNDEFQIINGHYLSYSGHCNVSLIWVLLTKTAHLFYGNHRENECSAPRQHGHSEQFNPEQFSINNGRSLLNPNSFHVNLSLHLTEVISIMTHIFVNFNNDTYFCYSITSYVRPPVHKHQAKWQRHTIFLCYFWLLFYAFRPLYLKRNIKSAADLSKTDKFIASSNYFTLFNPWDLCSWEIFQIKKLKLKPFSPPYRQNHTQPLNK